MEAVREMLRKENKKKEMALHVAARNGRSLGVVKAILSKEDPHFTYSANRYWETPLYLAIDNTRTDIVAELLNNPNSQSLQYDGRLYGETVLHKAVERWDIRMISRSQISVILVYYLPISGGNELQIPFIIKFLFQRQYICSWRNRVLWPKNKILVEGLHFIMLQMKVLAQRWQLC
ncbi:uncharacterized protein LOC110651292 [Hevea brasiliensis]|uniref:uncharacterized protein LOC110651292 n=1 Tax=Hevea brasiliensis TaxID=3981 RepID=UPI0025D2529C|nr:uncharacterized protein LOC110651292 [Hevea brasiliensis]